MDSHGGFLRDESAEFHSRAARDTPRTGPQGLIPGCDIRMTDLDRDSGTTTKIAGEFHPRGSFLLPFRATKSGERVKSEKPPCFLNTWVHNAALGRRPATGVCTSKDSVEELFRHRLPNPFSSFLFYFCFCIQVSLILRNPQRKDRLSHLAQP